MEDEIKDIMVESTTKVVTQAYEDIAHPILKSIGNIVSLPFKAIDAALTPIKKWVDKRNFNYEETKKILAQKLENIEEDKIVEPEAYVAVPALQQLSYSYDSVDLRNMYANLLASSMVESTKFSVHPSFVDIIKQLSPLDARALNILYTPQYITVINISAHYIKIDSYKELYNNYSLELAEIYRDNLEQSSSLLNLERLGIIQIDYERTVSPKSRYDIYDDSFIVNRAKERYKDDKEVEIDIKQGLIRLTDFGLSFCMTCCDKKFEEEKQS